MHLIEEIEKIQTLIESILLEITEKTVLYHRSSKKYNVGDILTPHEAVGKGEHVSRKRKFEQGLERVRLEKYPNKPSRFKSVFCSLVPRSRFIGKGLLYGVTPIGNFHVTNSELIDELGELESRERLGYYDIEDIGKEYWSNTKIIRSIIKAYEVLCDKVKVVEVIDEKGKDIKLNDKIKLLTNLELEWYAFKPDGNVELTDLETWKILQNYKRIKSYKEVVKYKRKSYNLILKKGTILKIVRINPNILKVGDRRSKNPKYISLMGSPIEKKFNTTFNLKWTKVNGKRILDIEKHVKIL